MLSRKKADLVRAYSFHPRVLAQLQRLLEEKGLPSRAHRLDSAQISDLQRLPVPAAAVYVIEANTRRHAAAAVAEEIVTRQPEARLLAVAEKFDEAAAFPLLRLGVKGLLRTSELAENLGRAVQEVAAGGFWVPRALLSRFVDSTLVTARRPRVVSASRHLSRREREVHELLMENLSNKEIARRLHMGERTVKFHVSNLLAKHGVKRRTDLILLCFAEATPA